MVRTNCSQNIGVRNVSFIVSQGMTLWIALLREDHDKLSRTGEDVCARGCGFETRLDHKRVLDPVSRNFNVIELANVGV